MMKVLIVEDEIMAQKSLTRLLMQNFSDMSVVGYTDSIKSTVSWLRTEGNSADIIFMECSLPGSFVHGFLLARILEWPAISFPRNMQLIVQQTINKQNSFRW